MNDTSSRLAEKIYAEKGQGYFAGCRRDYVDALPQSPTAAILEIGCAEGATGAYALQSGKCARYVGIEMHAPSAAIAQTRLSEVLVGNAETMELPFAEGQFDALIISEVLEHLVDPWALLARLHSLLKPGAHVFASSPNVSHYRIILDLIKGRWELTDRGIMDLTHLRWFTPASYCAMFESAGFDVVSQGAVSRTTAKQSFFNLVTGGVFSHLLIRQINIHALKRAG